LRWSSSAAIDEQQGFEQAGGIVGKVEHLRRLCDALEAALRRSKIAAASWSRLSFKEW
jgi:hypothetical protein